MSIKKLILEAYDQGIRLTLKDGTLVAVSNGKKMDAALRERVKESKDDIVAYLETQARHDVGLDKGFMSIPVAAQQESYPIPTSLFRIWVLSQFRQGNVAYNMPGAVELDGAFNTDTFTRAFDYLIARHEILRTVFREDTNGEVRQFIKLPDASGFKIEYSDFTKVPDNEEKLSAIIGDLVVEPFDLAEGPLLRAYVFRLRDTRHVFFFNMHHIINDGWSMEVFINEIFYIYNALHKNRPLELQPLRIQYKDYTLWQLSQLRGAELEIHRSYWLKQFSGEIPVLELPGDYPRPAVQTYNGAIARCSWPAQMTEAVNTFAKLHDGTPFMALLSAVYALLYRYTFQEDIIIGSPTAGRIHADLESQLGFYVNTLALRARFDGSKSFSELFRHVKQVTLEAFDHQVYPFGDLVDELDLARDISRSPLFDVMLVLHNNEVQGAGDTETKLGDLDAHHYSTDYVTSKFDLSFYFKEVDGEMKVSIEYNTDIFSAQQVDAMLVHFERLLQQMIARPDLPLASFDFLTPAEQQRQLAAALPVPSAFSDRSITEVFRQQVETQPQALALRDGGQVLTYGELDKLSDRIAFFLRDRHKIKEEELIGIMLPLGMQYVAAVIGVLKAGGAYVPIEVTHPFQRVKSIVEDAQIRLIVTQNEYNETADHLQWECSTLPGYLTLDNDNRFNEIPAESEKESQELWDYVATESSDDIIKAGGWIDSYSGEPFSAQEMEEFSENVKHKLKGYLDKTKKVLEIGCGSGLILRKIAPLVSLYAATDISPVLVNKLSRYAENEGITNLVTRCITATQVHELDLGKFDVIILNSVVQYFPGHGYLRKVIEQCLDVLSDDGVLFLGDIMDLDTRKMLIEEHIAYKKMFPSAPTKLDFTAELFLSNAYFDRLSTQGNIAQVETSRKHGTIQNELTQHRYDALIFKGTGKKAETHTRRYYQSDIDNQPEMSGSIKISPDRLAYVTYTSGSTGRPKGVMISHRNVVSFLANYEPVFGIAKGMSVGALTNISFDISVLELIGSLCLGMEAVFLPGNDPSRLADEIKSNPVDVLQLTPSRLQQLMFCSDTLSEDLHAVKALLVGGEALSEAQYEWLKSLTATHVLNVYGPTETTVWSSALDVRNSNILSIGQPLIGEQIYVLDAAGKLVPRGVVGEIFIGGTGLSRGYAGRPELTKERFVENPYNKQERIYATGDLGRWTADGNLAFVGRKDNQVKVRGYRIELGEIEAVLVNHPAVKAAIVLVNQNGSTEAVLVAFVIVRQPANEEELQAYAAEILPVYMVPAAFVQLESFPMLPSGKIDRKQLAEMGRTEAVTDKVCIKPRGPVEEKLLGFWTEVLGRKAEQISIDENFFFLGGHSLKATRLMSMINKAFDVSLQLNDLFARVTIEEQGQLIAASGKKIFAHIPKLPEQESYELSSPQLRLWVLSQFEAGNIAYNMPGVFRINGVLDEQLFTASFDYLIRRHEILRTVFVDVNGEARQVVLQETQLNFKIDNYDLCDTADAISLMEADIGRRKLEPFNLRTGPLLKACLYHLEESRFVFFFNMHHIISDGWSMEVFMREMIVVYNALLSGRSPELRDLPVQYKDYAAWQRGQLKDEYLARHRSYWLEQFSGDIPVLGFPEGKPRPEVMRYRGDEVKGMLDPQTAAGLQALVRAQGATLFMGLLAGVNAIFNKYTGASDIIIGTPLAGREHADLEDQIGFYINTLALRTRFDGTDNFSRLLNKVKEVTLGAYDHQVYPFDQLIDELKLGRDISRSPLFNVMVILQNNEAFSREMTFDNFSISTYESRTGTSKFDLTFIFTETTSGIEFILEYNSDIYTTEQMERLSGHYAVLLSAMVQNETVAIDRLKYLSPEETAVAIEMSNQTEFAYDKTQTFVSLFEMHVKSTPRKTALIFEDTTWSYEQLNAEANQLASWLESRYTIGPDDLVAIQLHRSPRMIIAMLAVLKSGAAYVPIDPNFPQERISYVLEDSDCKLCIDANELALFQSEQELFPPEDKNAMPAPGDLAYVIYTSGSTGRPKGVMIEHRSVTSFLQNMEQAFHLSGQSVIAATTNFTFDISVLELLGSLATGATCYLLDEQDPQEILKLVRDQKINALQLTPSRLKQFFAADADTLQTLGKLQVLLVGGEALSGALYDLLKQLHNTKVINVYGPTETTIWSSCLLIEEGKALSIGSPLLNERIYILDKHRQPVPPGVSGELYIGGQGLARGYRNKPEMTAEKFVDDPFVPGDRMYRTGDIGCRLPDGTIAFKGRTDDQVKIRGYRIEPGEIERALLACEAVQSCFVTVLKDETGMNELVAYLVSRDTLQIRDIRVQLEQSLPSYMVPAFFVQLEKLPLTFSGKVDVKNLPPPDRTGLSQDISYIAPRTETERILIRIWSDVLNISGDEISIDADFFDTGGNSINAITLIAQVNNLFGLDLPLISLFRHPTVADLSAAINSAVRPALHSGIVPLQPEGEGSPLFLVAGTGGLVTGFYPLVQALENTCPVYGLEPKGILGDEAPLSSVEELAAYYIEAVRGIQANGPYRLLGHSFGAYVVFEMAAQLNAAGEEVAQLFLFDTPATEREDMHAAVMSHENLKLGLLHTMQQYFDWSLPVSDEAYLQMEEIQQHELIQQMLADEGMELSLDQVRGYSNVFVAQGTTRYYPGCCLENTQIVLFKTAEMDTFVKTRGTDTVGWELFSTRKPHVHDVPGSHISMLKKEHIAEAAAYLKAYVSPDVTERQTQDMETA